MGNGKIGSIAIDNIARRALNGILAQSIEERKEYGGMIYMLDGCCRAMPPRTQGYPNTVDVGQNQPNCSCPAGAKPIAYYHTHPICSIAGMTARYNEFNDDDISVVTDHDLGAGYVGTLDGSFIKYDSKVGKPPLLLPGRLENEKKPPVKARQPRK